MAGTVLLTGATGFLGSHLLRTILERNHQVVILKRSTSDTARIQQLLKDVESINIDNQPISTVFDDHNIDCIIHTACNYGRKNDTVTNIVDVNLMFALNLLQQAVKHKVECFINTATILPNDINPYALSKFQFSEWLRFYSKDIQAINIKVEHMYGPGDDNQKFILWLMEQILTENKEIELTAGEQKRDFVFIDDVVAAYMLILEKRRQLAEWNDFELGSGKPVPIKDLVIKLKELIERYSNRKITSHLEFGVIPYRPDEVMDSRVDTTKLQSLGWRLSTTLDQGLKKTVMDKLGNNML